MERLHFQCALRTIREDNKNRAAWYGRLADIDNVITITYYDEGGELHRVGFLASDDIDTSNRYAVTLPNPLIFAEGKTVTGRGRISIDYMYVIKLSNKNLTIYL